MKTTKVLLLSAVVSASSFTTFAGTGAYQLLPQSASQPKLADNTVTTIAYVDSAATLQTPRAASNPSKIVKGTNSEVNPALECKKVMVGSPKAVAECSSHTTMPGCAKVASAK
jgi:hypothetical protein